MNTILPLTRWPRLVLSLVFILGATVAAERTGFPSTDERAGLTERQKVLRADHAHATLRVVPVAARGGAPHEIAARVAEAVAATRMFAAATAPTDLPVIRLPRGGMNEAKMLWDFARAVQAYLKENPGDADYALAVDYGFNPNKWEQGYAHFVLCDRQGEWVVVDMQNSHHKDYKAIKPTSALDCERLIVQRLVSHLNEAPAKAAK